MAESYDDLIFRLGDLAREHLVDSPNIPAAMDPVLEAEEAILQHRAELEQIEGDMNALDAEYQDFLDQKHAELAEQKAIVAKWKTAVVGVENRSRDLKKKVQAQKAAFRTQRISMKRAEASHKDLEMREGHDVRKITTSKENLKKFRLRIMRMQRDLEDLEFEFRQVLTPRPGQAGAQGILAHRRIMEVEDELEDRKADHEFALGELDTSAAAMEAEIKELEGVLDDAIFGLGEEVYAERIPHKAFKAVYEQLDRAK